MWHRWQEAGHSLSYPLALQDEFQRRYLMERINTRVRTDELKRVLAELEQHNLRVLVLKGMALAHLLYPEPSLRPSSDIDLLIASADQSRAEALLQALGYAKVAVHTFEASFYRQVEALEYRLDLHWKLSDSPFFGPLFDFEDMYGRALTLGRLGTFAKGLELTDALLHACIHLVGHREWDHLIWLLDIDLLVGRLTESEFEIFVERALAKECGEVCGVALQRVRETFGTELSEAALQRLLGRREPSAYLLNPKRDLHREFEQLFRVSPWRRRFALLWQVFLPPIAMINSEYKPDGDKYPVIIHLRRWSRLPFKIWRHYQKRLLGRFFASRR